MMGIKLLKDFSYWLRSQALGREQEAKLLHLALLVLENGEEDRIEMIVTGSRHTQLDDTLGSQEPTRTKSIRYIIFF